MFKLTFNPHSAYCVVIENGDLKLPITRAQAEYIRNSFDKVLEKVKADPHSHIWLTELDPEQEMLLFVVETDNSQPLE